MVLGNRVLICNGFYIYIIYPSFRVYIKPTVPSTYNMILGKPFMRMAKLVLLTYHLVMKFSTEVGIGEVRGNQIMARECYLVAVRGKQKLKRL